MKLARDVRRRRFLEVTDAIGKTLDAKGVTADDVERDFAAFRERRRAARAKARGRNVAPGSARG